jgi:hypothetical protein
MKKLLIAAFALTAGAAFAESPYDSVYSIITTDTKPSSDYLLKPVFVNRVDGQNSVERSKHVVPPGPHQVTVDLAPRGGFHEPTQTTFDLVTKPCVRYYVAAKLVNSISQQWQPVVRYTEPIGECEAKFKVAGK